MSMKVLIDDYPHRSVAIATDEDVLVFRHTHSANPSATSLPLPDAKGKTATPRCLVEFARASSLDLSHHRNVAAARGCLGLITLNKDVFLCVVTGSVEAATPRPGESIQRIYAVEFCQFIHFFSKVIADSCQTVSIATITITVMATRLIPTLARCSLQKNSTIVVPLVVDTMRVPTLLSIPFMPFRSSLVAVTSITAWILI
jgi:hypothetical protein